MPDESGPESAAPTVSTTPSRGSSVAWAVVAVVVLILIGVAVGFAGSDADDDASSNDSWQAVFLSSGQVYFGHLTNATGPNMTLENIYYLQVQQVLQPAPDPEASTSAADKAQQQVSLAKLGKFELHCPEDRMTINRDQVLFWEDLQGDSKVVRAIHEYADSPDSQRKCYERASGTAAPDAASAPATTTTSTTAP